MTADAITDLVGVHVHMTAIEARELYAQLYRVASDELVRPWPNGSQVQALMQQLASVGADS